MCRHFFIDVVRYRLNFLKTGLAEKVQPAREKLADSDTCIVVNRQDREV